MHNLSYETEILLHGHCLANQTHIHKKVVHLESLWRVFEAEVKSNSEPMLLEKDWVLLTSPKHSPIVNTPSLYNRHPKKPPNNPTNALKRMWAKKKKTKEEIFVLTSTGADTLKNWEVKANCARNLVIRSRSKGKFTHWEKQDVINKAFSNKEVLTSLSSKVRSC